MAHLVQQCCAESRAVTASVAFFLILRVSASGLLEIEITDPESGDYTTSAHSPAVMGCTGEAREARLSAHQFPGGKV